MTFHVTHWQPDNDYRMTFGEWHVRGGKNPPSVGDKQYQGGTDGIKAEIEVTEVNTSDLTLTIHVKLITKYPFE